MNPLNGVKTHPLSSAALEALQSLAKGPSPAQNFNPGIVNRLLREPNVEIVMLPSPFKTHKAGTQILHLRLVESTQKL